jgi:hypothetical protein
MELSNHDFGIISLASDSTIINLTGIKKALIFQGLLSGSRALSNQIVQDFISFSNLNYQNC